MEVAARTPLDHDRALRAKALMRKLKWSPESLAMLRERMQLSQKAFVVAYNATTAEPISLRTYKRWELGETAPDGRQITQLAMMLQIDLIHLFELDRTPGTQRGKPHRTGDATSK